MAQLLGKTYRITRNQKKQLLAIINLLMKENQSDFITAVSIQETFREDIQRLDDGIGIDGHNVRERVEIVIEY